MATRQPPGARTTPFVRVLVALAALARCLSSGVSAAAEPPRVVMVSEGALPAAGERVRAELAAMGFAVVLEEGSSVGATGDALAEVAQLRDAVATVVLTFSREGIELWVVERAKHETRLRRFVSAEPANSASTLPLRAAEMLRASLLTVAGEASSVETAAVDAPPPEPAQPVRQQVSTTRPPEVQPAPNLVSEGRTVTLRLGAAVAASAGGLAAFPGVELAGKLWLTEHVGAELAALVPLARMSERSDEGSSSTRVGALSLGIAGAVPLGNSAWIWDIGAGVAGVALQTRGTPASSAYTRKETVAYALAPVLRSALSYSLTHRWRLGLGGSLGVSVPRFLIVYAGRAAATWGVPFAVGQLLLEVDVP